MKVVAMMRYLYKMEDLSKFKAVREPTSLPMIVDIHIEEPELSLFPDAQCNLIEEMFLNGTRIELRAVEGLLYLTDGTLK